MFSKDLICDVIKYIDINLNDKISLDILENRFFYNKFYIIKLFKNEIGYTIVDYINVLRIYNSIRDIKYTDKSITRIALDNGFYSLEYFSEIFKKVIGVSPRKYKSFLNYNNNLDFDTKFKIRDNILKINDLVNFKNKYLSNIKPSYSPVKSLSIFK